MTNSIEKLASLTGRSVVRYLTNAEDNATVQRWIDETHTPDIDQLELIVHTLSLLEKIGAFEDNDIAYLWLFGTLPDGSESPLEALRNGRYNYVASTVYTGMFDMGGQ